MGKPIDPTKLQWQQVSRSSLGLAGGVRVGTPRPLSPEAKEKLKEQLMGGTGKRDQEDIVRHDDDDGIRTAMEEQDE